MKKDLTTKEIENRIEKAGSMEDLKKVLSEIPKITFHSRFCELCDARDLTFSQVQIKSGITKSLFYGFFEKKGKNSRKIQKHHIIKIGVAIGLTVEEVNELLKLANHKELYAKRPEDAIVIYGLNNNLDASQIEELLIEAETKFSLF